MRTLDFVVVIMGLLLLGKTRYGICINFYRAVERATATGPQRVLRRDSWRKSMEKSSDSAFSR